MGGPERRPEVADPGFESNQVDDWDVLDRFIEPLQEWWVAEFGEFIPQNGGFFTPPQKRAIPLIQDGTNTLICSPTGSGKTLASYGSILNELFRRERRDGLENSVYCLYVSPLKSLANDIHRNLEVPLDGIRNHLTDADDVGEIRHEIRHGDTSAYDRQKMLDETPHILNTTPETLAIMLNSPKLQENFRTVEYVIVDEIHSLAESKRGTHLAVSLERLENMTAGSPTRIGCSATVEPLDRMAEFLVGRSEPGGPPREYELVDTRFVRDFDLQLECPAPDLIYTPNDTIQDRFYTQLHEYVQDHTTTLVFTNTRAGAERVLHNLRSRYSAYTKENSGCHHGSLSKGARTRIEEQLKSGTVDVVTSSTSLELGIDMPSLDLVVQVGSPKSVAALLQRVGRAGHQLGQTVHGRVIALDRDDLVECTVMTRKAEEGFIDRVFIPENAHDVAAQHVYGMAINAVRPEREVVDTLRRAYPYRDYTDADLEQLFTYLTLAYDELEEQNVYAKIWRDENDPPHGEHHYPDHPVGEPLIGKRGRLARPIYMTNVGTIPDSFACDVFTRGDEEWVGELDEEYLDTLSKGDVFVLGGERYEYRYRRTSKVYVEPADDRPTVPSWYSERLPLSFDLGCEILSFQQEVIERMHTGGNAAVRAWLRDFPIDENAVRAVSRMYDEQIEYTGITGISTPERLVVEEHLAHDEDTRYYYVHSNYGRRFNDGFSRLLGYQCAKALTGSVDLAVADSGFSISMPSNRKVDIAGLIEGLDPGSIRRELRESLAGTELLKRYFRMNATRSLLVLKQYKGYEKSAKRQQLSSEILLAIVDDIDGFAVLEETYRELLEDKLAVGAIEDVVEDVVEGRVDVSARSVRTPSPLAFGLATLIESDVVLAADESAMLQTFHEEVLAAIENDSTSSAT